MKIFTSMIVVLIAYSPGMATVVNVPGDAATIQAGIDASTNGDTVLVATGTYYENVIYNGKNVVVLSVDGAENTIIDGSWNRAVVQFMNGESRAAELNGFTIKNGTGEISLTNVESTFGGGICMRYGSSPTLRDLIVTQNSALGFEASGGGIGVSTGSEPLIEDVIITENVAYMGAGLFCYFSAPTIRNVTISTNHATSSGGGAGFQTSKPVLEEILIYDNTAEDYAGGIWFYDKSEAVLNRVTIYGNSCSNNYGGGIWTLGQNTVYILNSVCWYNTPDQIASYVSGVYAAGSIGVAYSNIQDVSTDLDLVKGELIFFSDNMQMDPGFVDPANHDFNLDAGSSCLDAGTDFFVWGADTLINIPEVGYIGVAPDMGALESVLTLSNDQISTHPEAMILSPNFPNPFNPSTQISYTLDQPAIVSIDIYDIQGALTKTLFSGWQGAGSHFLEWNGSDQLGKQLNSGVYLYRLSSADKMLTRTMLLLR